MIRKTVAMVSGKCPCKAQTCTLCFLVCIVRPTRTNGKWTPDGKYFIFESKGQIWGLPEKTGFFRRSTGTPFKLTDSPLKLASPLPSKDGTKLFVLGQRSLGELVRYDAKSGQFLPFLSGISAENVAFSKDGNWVAYVSYPDGVLWRTKVDGSERLTAQ